MSTYIIILLVMVYVFDFFMLRKYEIENKELQEENKNLKEKIKLFEVE